MSWKDALAEVERLRGLLAHLEWACEGSSGMCCPVCGEYEDQGHVECWLAAELGR